MLRRDFSFGMAATSLAGAAAGVASPLAQAQPLGFKEGVDFIALDKRVVSEVPRGKIEVVEFFWYSCGHCNAFEPALEAWIKKAPKDVVVRRVPIAFQPSFEPQQRLFYSLEAMGKLDALHAKVFYSIHVEKMSLNTFDSISAWVDKQGVDKAHIITAIPAHRNTPRFRLDAKGENGYPWLPVLHPIPRP